MIMVVIVIIAVVILVAIVVVIVIIVITIIIVIMIIGSAVARGLPLCALRCSARHLMLGSNLLVSVELHGIDLKAPHGHHLRDEME